MPLLVTGLFLIIAERTGRDVVLLTRMAGQHAEQDGDVRTQPRLHDPARQARRTEEGHVRDDHVPDHHRHVTVEQRVVGQAHRREGQMEGGAVREGVGLAVRLRAPHAVLRDGLPEQSFLVRPGAPAAIS